MTDAVDHLTFKPAPSAIGDPTPSQMMEALHTAFGFHHARAVHAKGILALGTFEPSPAAMELCSAALFQTNRVPAVFRFSDFTGIPNIPDASPSASPRGFAVKLRDPSRGGLDIVAHSFNGFPTATSEEFRELLMAIGASRAGASQPTALDRFLDAHPTARTFLTTQKPPPVSYLTISYFGVNAFRFQGPAGASAAVRHRFTPIEGEQFLPVEVLASKDPDYLIRELPHRLAGGPVSYRWLVQVAELGDDLADPSTAWPESRRLVDLGQLTITELPTNPEALDREIAFMPVNAPAEITAADPMLSLRQDTYPLSFRVRQ